MLRRMITNILAIMGLLLISSQLAAEPQHPEFTLHSQTPPMVNDANPAFTIHHLISDSRFSDYLFNHPSFIKIQDMAYQVWGHQTGRKYQATHENDKIYSIKID